MALSAEEIETVYERRYAGFRLGAAAILDDFDAAHDAVQDGFARALVDRDRCRGTSPEAWIWRIVERKAFDERRRRRFQSGSCGGRQAPAAAAAAGRLPALLRRPLLCRDRASLRTERRNGRRHGGAGARGAPAAPRARGDFLGQTLYRAGKEPQHLAAPLRASLLGQDATLVVSSPDGRRLAYHSWRGRLHGVPLLLVHDTVTGADRLLARGAQTLAWSRDGRIAYLKADRVRYDERNGAYVGRVMVQTLNGVPVAWTRRSGGYQVLA